MKSLHIIFFMFIFFINFSHAEEKFHVDSSTCIDGHHCLSMDYHEGTKNKQHSDNHSECHCCFGHYHMALTLENDVLVSLNESLRIVFHPHVYIGKVQSYYTKLKRPPIC